MRARGTEKKEWYKILFVEHPELYLPFLVSEFKNGKDEAKALKTIFRNFGLKKEAKILDLSCGIGRHSIPLALMGYDVVGCDISDYYLRIAKQRASSEDIRTTYPIRFYRAELGKVSQTLKKKGETDFDAIIFMFQSLGYGSSKEDLVTLRDIFNLASPHSLLVTETENKQWRLRNFQPIIHYEFGKLIVTENWHFNDDSNVFEGISRFFSKTASNKLKLLLQLKIEMRLYSLEELVNLLELAGWRNLANYKSILELRPPNTLSEMIITVNRARK